MYICATKLLFCQCHVVSQYSGRRIGSVRARLLYKPQNCTMYTVDEFCLGDKLDVFQEVQVL